MIISIYSVFFTVVINISNPSFIDVKSAFNRACVVTWVQGGYYAFAVNALPYAYSEGFTDS